VATISSDVLAGDAADAARDELRSRCVATYVAPTASVEAEAVDVVVDEVGPP
jgi:hypothetical protein